MKSKMKKRIAVAVAIAILCISFPSFASSAEELESETRNLFAMDTYMTLTAYGEYAKDALDAAEEEIRRLDELLSTGNENSEIYKLNQAGSAVLSEDSAYLMTRSLEVNEMTGGAFNPLIYPLMEAWGFTDKNYQVPDTDTIRNLLPLLDLSLVTFDRETGDLRFEKEGMKIDFGGIAKGYASSRVIGIFEDCGVEHAVISLGGNVQVLGVKPNGNLWKIAIVDPYDESAYIGILQTADNAVVTSGGYERNFEQDGIVYHHILDPESGCPADHGLVSVSVITDDGTLADGLSTSIFIMGLEASIDLWRQYSDLFEMVLLTDDNTVYVTEGIGDQFTSSVYPVNVIEH